MARDLTDLYNQQRRLKTEIRDKESELKKRKNEYSEIKKAYEKLDKNKLDVVNKAKEIEKKVKSKNSGANLAWRGERKKDFDKILDDQAAKEAKAFRKKVEQFKNEIKKEMDDKSGKVNVLDRKLNKGFFCLHAQLRRLNDQIYRLEREG